MTGATTASSASTGINQIGTYTFNTGLSTVTYLLTDPANNTSTCNFTVTITPSLLPLSGSISTQTNVACFGTSTGSVTVTGSDGLAPYEYKLDAGSYQSSGTFGALAAGTYSVTIRDATLNTFNVSLTITQPSSALGGSISSQINVLCFGNNSGSVTVSGTGGTPPYLYMIGTGAYQPTGTFGTLTAGVYTVIIQDANLCTFSIPVTIIQPAANLLGSIATQTNITCSGSANGSVTVAGTGGTPLYMYSLNGGTYQSSGLFSGLAPSTYTISVRDANLCTSSVSVTIKEPAVLSVTSTKVDATCPGDPTGSITLTISGGTQPYIPIWSDGISTIDRINIPDGTYSVIVTDLNGCAAPLSVIVGFTGGDNCIEIPGIITPNNDGFNDTWKIKNIDMFPNAEVFVFSRWGKLVFNSKNLSANPWNGTFNGKLLPTDSYHYVLHLNNGSQPRSGVISIIK
jgi:gliding motility-associated-like protein